MLDDACDGYCGFGVRGQDAEPRHSVGPGVFYDPSSSFRFMYYLLICHLLLAVLNLVS
jgi:hypothetical protein